MGFIPNNPVGGTVVSQASTLFDTGISLGTDFGYDTQYEGDFINIEGLPNVVISAVGSADGQSPEYPDANVGSLMVEVVAGYGNSGVFEAGQQITQTVVKSFTVAQTDIQTYVPPSLYEQLYIPAPLVKFNVYFLPNDRSVAGNFGKIYIRLVASA